MLHGATACTSLFLQKLVAAGSIGIRARSAMQGRWRTQLMQTADLFGR